PDLLFPIPPPSLPPIPVSVPVSAPAPVSVSCFCLRLRFEFDAGAPKLVPAARRVSHPSSIPHPPPRGNGPSTSVACAPPAPRARREKSGNPLNELGLFSDLGEPGKSAERPRPAHETRRRPTHSPPRSRSIVLRQPRFLRDRKSTRLNSSHVKN